MIDHLLLHCRDRDAAEAFYAAALPPLGFMISSDGADGFSFKHGEFEFYVQADGPPSGPVHVAFKADSQAAVRSFHVSAMAAGGRDNGAPGPRPGFGENYYAAFALDPDGNNIEAVYNGQRL